jgi:hypothetical protein
VCILFIGEISAKKRLLETAIRAGDGLEFFIRLARVFAIASSEGRG